MVAVPVKSAVMSCMSREVKRYKTVFWSIAHADWDPENQPGVDVSYKTITDRLHPGAVILLHSTSPDNVEILGKFIDYCRSQGYEFRSLDEYEHWN